MARAHVEARFVGVAALAQAFAELPQSLQRGALRSAALGAAEPIRARAAALAPRGRQKKKASAILSRNILAKVTAQTAESVTVRIGPARGVPHAHLVEFGTRPHLIRAGTFRGRRTGKRVLAVEALGQLFGRVAQHPGTPPRPFLRPALDEQGAAAQARFGERLWASIQAIAAKLAAGKIRGAA